MIYAMFTRAWARFMVGEAYQVNMAVVLYKEHLPIFRLLSYMRLQENKTTNDTFNRLENQLAFSFYKEAVELKYMYNFITNAGLSGCRSLAIRRSGGRTVVTTSLG